MNVCKFKCKCLCCMKITELNKIKATGNVSYDFTWSFTGITQIEIEFLTCNGKSCF